MHADKPLTAFYYALPYFRESHPPGVSETELQSYIL